MVFIRPSDSSRLRSALDSDVPHRASHATSAAAASADPPPMPDATGNVLLDFNQARNPPCAFTSFATCPLPPPENRLDLAINAGEKAYRHASP